MAPFPIDSLPEGRGAWREGGNTWAIWFGQGDWTGGVGPNLPHLPLKKAKFFRSSLRVIQCTIFNLTTTKGQKSTLHMECGWARRAAKVLYMPSLLKEYPCQLNIRCISIFRTYCIRECAWKRIDQRERQIYCREVGCLRSGLEGRRNF